MWIDIIDKIQEAVALASREDETLLYITIGKKEKQQLEAFSKQMCIFKGTPTKETTVMGVPIHKVDLDSCFGVKYV